MNLPDPIHWKGELARLGKALKALSRSRNLVDAYVALSLMDRSVARAVELCDLPANRLGQESTKKEIKSFLMDMAEIDGKDRRFVLKRFNLPNNYGEAKNQILLHANSVQTFTVDDLVRKCSALNIPRRVWSANLYSLATKGDKPLVRVKAGVRGPGSTQPAVYAARR